MLRWTFAPLILMLSLPAFALKLDCERQADGTYLCVEITETPGAATGAAAAGPGTKPSEETSIDDRYIERAKQDCEYREPRRRAIGKASPASVVEERKLAREAYEKCLRERAAELQKAEQ